MSTIFYDFIRNTLGRAFWKVEVIGLENVIKEEPAVFIANHSGSSGPESILSSLPLHLHTWILQQTIDIRQSAEYLRHDFVEKELKFKPPFSNILSFLLSLIAVPFLKSLNTIPVYKNSKLLEKITFPKSLEILEKNKAILIFPEDPKPIPNNPINPFQKGFTKLGDLFYKKTGKLLKFYPVTFHSKKKKIVIGKPVSYDPSKSFNEERSRLTRILENRIHLTLQSLQKSKR